MDDRKNEMNETHETNETHEANETNVTGGQTNGPADRNTEQTGPVPTVSGGRTPAEIPRSGAEGRGSDPSGGAGGPNDPNGPSAFLRFRRGGPNERKRLAVLTFAGLVALLLLAVVLMARAARSDAGKDGGTTEDPSAGTTADPSVPEETGLTPEELYRFDPASVPEGAIGIRPTDLSGAAGTVLNGTALSPDLTALLEGFASREKPTVGSDPLVLILHTHATEGYTEAGTLSWDGTGDFGRSADPARNVLAVGAVLAETLNAAGIPTLHATDLHDVAEDGTVTNVGAYARSRETVGRYLDAYPSIRYIIDLQRDTVFDEDGNAARAVTLKEGRPAAQVLLTVGGGTDPAVADWASNLSFALALSAKLNESGARLARSPALETSVYNQDLTRGRDGAYSILLEVGTAANSLDEAKTAAAAVGEAIAELLRGEGA